MEKQWCLNVRRNLRDAKRYLKTDFRVIASHMILLALTTVDILRLVTLSKPTSKSPVHMNACSVAMDEECTSGSQTGDQRVMLDTLQLRTTRRSAIRL